MKDSEKNDTSCLRCGGETTTGVVKAGREEAIVVIAGEPDSFLGVVPYTSSPVGARVCKNCGHIDLYARALRDVLRVDTGRDKSRAGFSNVPDNDRPNTRFPSVLWKREAATFIAAPHPPAPDLPEPAGLVFPFYGDRIVLADIAGRGWCIPSGHIEPGETAEDAMRREAHEEAGVTLGTVVYIGYFLLTDTKTHVQRRAPTFIASVTAIGDVPTGTESRGMQMANVEDIASLYFAWDDLLADVFAYACREKEAHLRSGISLSHLSPLDNE